MVGLRRVDLAGQRFGRLTVIRVDATSSTNNLYWVCRCDCGSEKTVRGSHLKGGIVASCGCYRREWAQERMTRHGQSQTQAHRTWRNMRDRCQNPRSREWKDYGGRGITVCERWRDSFESFYADMGQPPSSKHSIDRVNNDLGYEPGNCRWATAIEQVQNRRSSVWIEYNGERKTLKAWADQIGAPYARLLQRHIKGEQPPHLFRPVETKSHCKRGHPFDESNTYLHANGSRDCRQCRKEAGQRRRTREG